MGLSDPSRSARTTVIRTGGIAYLLAFQLLVGSVFPACGRTDTPLNATNAPCTRGALVVRISGVKQGKGSLNIALCTSSEEWNGDTTCFRTARVDAAAGTVAYAFDDLSDGDYALKVFQDENDNHVLDKDFMGVPLEGYGFSTAARALFGPPSYHKAAFRFKGPAMTIAIALE